MEDPILNPKAAAKYLCCSESFLAKLRCTGGGPEFIKVGASIAYRRSALDAWTRKRTFKSTTEADALLGGDKQFAPSSGKAPDQLRNAIQEAAHQDSVAHLTS
jgi:predicted DNA-binding transcriptional regulator AlpA